MKGCVFLKMEKMLKCNEPSLTPPEPVLLTIKKMNQCWMINTAPTPPTVASSTFNVIKKEG
jgi:hypothetical protein